jgi:hypothetical protein
LQVVVLVVVHQAAQTAAVVEVEQEVTENLLLNH